MFIAKMSKLIEGDILLTAQKGLVSKSVRKLTNSQFSHAILYVGQGSYIHSDSNGVHSDNIQRLMFQEKENLKVLRVKEAKFIENACIYARTQIGKEYSIKEAIKTKNPLTKNKDNNKQFCSRLVAQAYEFSGLNIVHNSLFCTPQELDDSQFTEAINNSIRVATKEEIQFSQSYNPLKKQADITNDILNKIRVLTKQDIQSLEQVTELLFNNPEYDKEVTEYFKKSGYLTMWEYERKNHGWRYDGRIFLSLPLSDEEKKLRAGFELEHSNKRLQLYKNNLEQYFIMFQQTNLAYAKIHFELYGYLVKQTIENINSAKYVLKNT